MKSIAVVILVIFVALSSCQRNENGEVKLQILNKEIAFIDIGNQEYFYQYVNEVQRQKSITVVEFQLENNTNKNLLFFFNDQYFLPSNNKMTALGQFSFNISNLEHEVKLPKMPLVNFNEDLNYWFPEAYFHSDSVSTYNARLLGVKKSSKMFYDNFTKNSFVLHPSERRTIKIPISLPIIREINPKTGTSPISYTHLKKNYQFSIVYSCNATDLQNHIPSYLIDDLKVNNTEIFTGIITSNAVTLKPE